MSWRPLSDMEVDGIRFTEEQKEVLEENRMIEQSKWCHYSDLPSPKFYEYEDNDRGVR